MARVVIGLGVWIALIGVFLLAFANDTFTDWASRVWLLYTPAIIVLTVALILGNEYAKRRRRR